MSYKTPEGCKFLFSTTFAAAKAVATLSNGDPAVAGVTGHGYTEGQEILLISGWEDATDSVYLVGNVPGVDSFEVAGLDTSDTDWFAPGGGVGTVQLISNWIEIPQVLTTTPNGGDPRFVDVNPLARRNGFQIPTGFNPASLSLTLGHDAGNANYKTMKDISRTLQKVAFKQLLADGSATYGYGVLTVQNIAQLTSGQVNQVTAVFAAQGATNEYEA